MLQIITGRFFKTAELHRTQQRTVLYSNYRGHDSIETVVGSYAPAASSADVASAVYLVEQRLEAVRPDGSRPVVIAVHPEALAQDFAALLSFCLRVTCTLDSALVSRLSQSNRPPIGVSSHPSRMVDQIFDREVWLRRIDEAVLPQFVADLVRLERARYRVVMRAIQRYVVGLHRIGDDLALAYTLLVASIESLAQGFDQFEPSWRDFDDVKRKRIDHALADADAATRRAVQSATLENEHVALGRRYREFALAYLPPSFYREEAEGREGPARAGDLPLALNRAYAFRSKLVHRLEELPSLLVHAPLLRDLLYHHYLPKEWHRPAAEDFLGKHISLFDDPSLESLICRTVLSEPTGWDPDRQEEMRVAYLEQRCHRNGLKLGPVLEVAVTLETAEAYRLAGDSQRARVLLSDAVENLPGSAMLLDVEQKWLAGEIGPLRWRDILLPN